MEFMASLLLLSSSLVSAWEMWIQRKSMQKKLRGVCGAQGEKFRILFFPSPWPDPKLGWAGGGSLHRSRHPPKHSEDKRNPWCGGAPALGLCWGCSGEHQDGSLTSLWGSGWGKAVPGHPLGLPDPLPAPHSEKCCPTPFLAPGGNPPPFLLLWDLFIATQLHHCKV